MSARTLYDVLDLMTKCSPADFRNFDVRITPDEFGRPGKGTEVVVFDKRTGEDVSEPLVDIFAKALVTRLHQTYPDTRCRLHLPYDRTSKRRWDGGAPCTCTLVFESRLRAALRVAELNRIDIAMAKIRTAHAANGHGAEADTTAVDRDRQRWLDGELHRLKA